MIRDVLLSTNNTFISIKIMFIDCIISTFKGLSMNVRLVTHNILTILIWKRCLIVFLPIILIFYDIFWLLCRLLGSYLLRCIHRTWIFIIVSQTRIFLLGCYLLLITLIRYYEFYLPIPRKHELFC